ncbi:MAG: class I SAM-dependent methyltransferase [Actinobacteria bacterium]|nr:class I SAM-dependent methyltransferase [Actinomycetota bacterium]MBU1944140.1 class I SAM-dependent methyltransferase [Actinomycetota bacterium]MBU2687459.1 class I SAM-dependent methyltransferase [Actinomycetota bacterium]
MNHERLSHLLRCPACGSEMRYRPKVYSYCCTGPVLHTYRVKDEIADMIQGEEEERQRKVDRAFGRRAGRSYEKNVTAAGAFDRFMGQVMWGTNKFIPLMFELLDSVASDCEPGYFLDIPVGTGVFTAGEYSLQPNLEFIAADYNRRMLEAALEKVRAEDFGNVMLVRTDARSLPFSDASFTGVLSMNGFGSLPEPERCLEELVRVLKPNGKFAGSMYVKGERLTTDLLLGRVGAWLGWFSGPFYTEEQFLGMLDGRGIKKVVTRKINSIMFFSGRKCAGEVPATPDTDEHTLVKA